MIDIDVEVVWVGLGWIGLNRSGPSGTEQNELALFDPNKPNERCILDLMFMVNEFLLFSLRSILSRTIFLVFDLLV